MTVTTIVKIQQYNVAATAKHQSENKSYIMHFENMEENSLWNQGEDKDQISVFKH